MPSHPGSADDLTLALTDALRGALATLPRTRLDPESAAADVAAVLAPRLAAAAVAAGLAIPELARALSDHSAEPAGSPEDRILAALRRHTAGRSPGVTPESLATLTGLPPVALPPAVSALVQAGDLVRDAWRVRLPSPEDLLTGNDSGGVGREGEMRTLTERRAIGDRRTTGERRLYDRRTLPDQ